MTREPYVPTPILPEYGVIVEQMQSIQNGVSPQRVIQPWLTFCFKQIKNTFPDFAIHDYQWALKFLYVYRGSIDTFTSYRRDLERLLQWSWFVKQQSCLTHTRDDMEAFIEFCQKPPKRWINFKRVARFKQLHGELKPNNEWRPFTAHITKKAYADGQTPQKELY